MLSKLIKEKIHHRFGQEIRYSKDCDTLASHISQSCKARVSGSTVRRLYGFVKGIREQRQYTLDIISEYLGHKNWDELLISFEKTETVSEKILERLTPLQIKSGQTVQINYEPRKQIEVKKHGKIFQVVSTNEKKLLLNDEVKFQLLELHYPLTFTHVIRQGNSIGRLQLATVSGIVSIRRA